jgi:tyrosinase
MVDLNPLGYTYDDFSPAVPPLSVSARFLRLGASAAIANEPKETVMAPPGQAKLIGANDAALSIVGSNIKTNVTLAQPERKALALSLNNASRGASPDRVYLNLENVTGAADGAILKVYVGPNKGDDPSNDPDLLAGTIALFGVRKASEVDGDQAGQGVSYVLDITTIADTLHVGNELDADKLAVSIVPLTPVPASDNIHVGRISIYRQAP